MHPNLEFGNVVWSPKFEKDKNLIESVQRRATRIIPGLKGKSYEERINIMKLPSLNYQRVRGDLIEACMYTQGLYKVPEGLLELETRTNTRGHGYVGEWLFNLCILCCHSFSHAFLPNPMCLISFQIINYYK
jgi:hypothetical protein